MINRLSRYLRGASLLALATMAIPIQSALAVPTDVFISEYIEGTSFNKAIEIYNGTGAPIDLGAGSYTLELYSNGSPTPSQSTSLSGTIANGDVYVLAHASASAPVLAQADATNSSVINFNGDDGLVLKKGGAIIDAFGQNAVDPGSQWPGGGQNDTLRRKATVCGGDVNFADAFNASVEWDIFPQDTFDNLGSHIASCGGADSAPLVTGTTPLNGATQVPIAANIDITFSEDVNTVGSWFDISCSTSGAHTAVVSGGPGSFSLDPDTDFSVSETCTVTIIAAQVTDLDSNDPPDNMGADYIFSFDTSTIASNDWVINEIHADPDSGVAGDANGDGVRHFGDDEFVEIFNNSGADADIGGWTLSDAFGLRHTFPNPTVVPADCAVVVFGGGTPTGIFGFAVVQTASEGSVGLSNGGDSVTLNDGTDDMAFASYGSEGGNNQSLTRDPDITGASPLVQHSTASGSGGALYSPGTTIDGSQFSGCIGDVKIHEVQGSGNSTPLSGYTVSIEGIVVGDFQDDIGDHGDLNGFFVQEEDADADADPLTSEGIFVFDGFSEPDVNVAQGDLVTVVGTVSERFGQTQISSTSGVTVTSSGNPLPTAATITLPFADVADQETMEGMSVTLPQDLTIVEYFNFDRFGQFVLSSERLIQPTAIFEPSADPLSDRAILADYNSRNRITIDDGRTSQNPDPSIHPNGSEFNLGNLFRGGDLVTDVTGVMGYAFGAYGVHPTQGAVYTATNPRSAEPDPVGGGLRFASFNVLNYFSTLDGSGNICGPAMDQGCRGADNAEEFTRQRDKIIAAIIATGADVLGLIEIENHIDDDAVIDLVAGLNAASAPGTWERVDAYPVGTDAIKVAFIFKPASVSEVGVPAILDSSVDPRFDDQRNRPALAQTFSDNSNGAVFTLVINHFKSKGSSCAGDGDPNLNDGAGNCNLTRTAAAEAMVDWLATDPTGSSDADIIILGDLNAYDKEDPIDALTDAGYTDMTAIYGGETAYGYVFSGATGYLDYALASPGLLAQITGVTDWHINADEPDLINYDTSFKRDAQDAIYAPDAYRSSDHDPVIGGADFLQYDFGGFQPPVAAAPALNKARAGRAIPMKFMLNDDYGLDILAPGYPLSQEIDCDDLSVLGDSEFAVSDDDIGLTYDAGEDQYKWVWKTSKDYGGSCRQFVIQLSDGGIHHANIEFK